MESYLDAMMDPTPDRAVDRSVDTDDERVNRQHTSADVAPELFEDVPRER
ncbi:MULTISPECIES: hypothetical protein [unclassified Halorubrum]|nr:MULTISPECIES: hypothetical protein [unclassified Halorubrum]